MARAGSMNEIIEQMFSEVRMGLKEERNKMVNGIKEDLKSAKQKAMMKMH